MQQSDRTRRGLGGNHRVLFCCFPLPIQYVFQQRCGGDVSKMGQRRSERAGRPLHAPAVVYFLSWLCLLPLRCTLPPSCPLPLLSPFSLPTGTPPERKAEARAERKADATTERKAEATAGRTGRPARLEAARPRSPRRAWQPRCLHVWWRWTLES